MKDKRTKSLGAQVRLEAQVQLLNKQIAQLGKPESWWRRNVVPIAAVVVSLFSALTPQARSTNIYLQPPRIEQQQQRSEDRKEKGAPPTQPFVPPRHAILNTIRNWDRYIVATKQARHRSEAVSLGGVSPLMPTIKVPTYSKPMDPATLSVLNRVYRVLETSDDPVATKAKIIKNLEQQPSLHKKLVDEKFVNGVINEVKKVEVLEPSEVWQQEKPVDPHSRS
jgi:hypothetical protein